jgi:hypothetical protein
MTRYGVDACTECGAMTELLLAPRFPHVCSLCLFPSQKPEDPTADLVDERAASATVWSPFDTLAERLHAHKSNGTWRGTMDSRAARGKNFPESYNRRGKASDGS